MIVKNATSGQLTEALRSINAAKYEGNIAWRREPEAIGRRFRFTLRAVKASGKGGRLGLPHASWTTRSGAPYKQRRIGGAACWHVHGDFFEALFKIAPEAVITSGGHRITAASGNWEDSNIGSGVEPFYFSEACECSR